MTFETDRQRFMFTAETAGSGLFGSGGGGAAQPVVPIHLQNRVEPLLMGPAYFARLKAAIGALPTAGEPVIYLAGWWFTPLFSLDQMTGGAEFAALLKEKARAGVDVRVLGWVLAPELMSNALVQQHAADAFRPSYGTMRFIKELRSEPAIADKAVCNILSHPAGAVHLKMAIVGNADGMTVFTGGLDCVNDRHDPIWRDVQLKLDGPAAQPAFDFYREMWNEVQGRPVAPLSFSVTLGGKVHAIRLDNRTTAMPALPTRTGIGRGAGGTVHAQSLRTVPQFNFPELLGLSPVPLNQKVGFAPDGAFDVDRGWRAAIGGAESYYYVEDQMLSSASLCDALNARLREDDDFRVVLVTGRFDPNDPPNDVGAWTRARALNFHLFRALDAGQKARVAVFNHAAKVVHCKIAIADDKWAFVGSPNFSTRSQFTDFEHGFAFMDESGAAVPAFRQQLWDSIFGAAEPDMAAALARWFAIPEGGTQGDLQRVRLPVAVPNLTSLERLAADSLMEVDSRQMWGTDLFAMLAGGALGIPLGS
ncbi:MAG: phospholipase D-like domain-containing protein [Paracoccaceae bacterium]